MRSPANQESDEGGEEAIHFSRIRASGWPFFRFGYPRRVARRGRWDSYQPQVQLEGWRVRDCPVPAGRVTIRGGRRRCAVQDEVSGMIVIIDYGMGNLRSVQKADRGRRAHGRGDRGPGSGAAAPAR